jgi:hypothetical protein
MVVANTDPTTVLNQLNAAGANGWRAVGLICAGGSAGNGGFACNAETLLVKETP